MTPNTLHQIIPQHEINLEETPVISRFVQQKWQISSQGLPNLKVQQLGSTFP